MSLPTITQTWTMSFNNRYSWGSSSTILVSLSTIMVSLKNFLKTTMGMTVKGSCDGTTGAMDGVDRWITAANAGVRFNGSAGAQSWFVVTDGAGVDWCFSYNSASDDNYRVGSSTGGVYVVAGTPNQQPTAVDECFNVQAQGMTGTSTVDRVWHLWGSADKKMWRMVICKESRFVSFLAGEKFVGSLVSPATFTLAAGGGTVGALNRYIKGADSIGGVAYAYVTYINNTYGTTNGSACRVFAVAADRQCNAFSGGEQPGGGVGSMRSFSNFFPANNPALQGGLSNLIFPVVVGCADPNVDGKLGSVIDEWYCMPGSNNIGYPFGQVYGQRQFWTINPGMILVGDGITLMAIA